MTKSNKIEEMWKERCFGGCHKVYSHFSSELNCKMQFSVYEPEKRDKSEQFDVLFFLSGASCNEQNFIMKISPQRYAEENRFILVGPDTSPRHVNIPGEGDHTFYGKSASWYMDALIEPWSSHYSMYSYIVQELPEVIKTNFVTTGKIGICGHSMGGNGAIFCGLRNPEIFESISAFCPTTHASTNVALEPAFRALLGEHNRYMWHIYDSTEIIKCYIGPYRNILVDQGLDDEYLLNYMDPQKLVDAVEENPRNKSAVDVKLRLHEKYTHSYFFVSSFLEDHFQHHRKIINQSK